MEPKTLEAHIEDTGNNLVSLHLYKYAKLKFRVRITAYSLVAESEWDEEFKEVSCRIRVYPTYITAYKNYKNFCKHVKDVSTLFHTTARRES